VLKPIVGSPRTALIATWQRDNPSPVLREFLESVRAFAARTFRKDKETDEE
jgi:hypothetical protein